HDHAEHTVKQHIVQHADGERTPGISFDAVASQQNEASESDKIHESVPSNRERSELDGNGINLRMNEHGLAFFSGKIACLSSAALKHHTGENRQGKQKSFLAESWAGMK